MFSVVFLYKKMTSRGFRVIVGGDLPTNMGDLATSHGESLFRALQTPFHHQFYNCSAAAATNPTAVIPPKIQSWTEAERYEIWGGRKGY